MGVLNAYYVEFVWSVVYRNLLKRIIDVDYGSEAA